MSINLSTFPTFFSNDGRFVDIKTNIMKTREELHESALSILSLIKSANEIVASMEDYNTNIAEPNGFRVWSYEDITQKKLVAQRLENSYLQILKEIVEL